MQQLVFEYSGWYILICLLVAFTAAFLLYFRTNEIPESYASWRFGLAILRFISVFIIAFLLLSPLWRRNITKLQKPILIVAQDASTSVGDFLKKNDPNYLSELNKMADDLKKDYQVETFSFGEKMANELPNEFSDKVTNISALLEELSTRFAGAKLGGVVLASDGIYNQGSNPLYTAAKLNVPIYTVGMGDTSIRKDLIINRIFHNQIVYAGDEMEVQIDVLAKNLIGKSSKISLVEVNGGKVKVLKSVDFNIDKSSFFNSFSLSVPASLPGTRYLRVIAAPVEGEVSKINNSRDFVITVLDGRQKVLIFAQSPHPDMGALRQSFSANKNIEVKTAFIDESVPNFAEYDVIILHQLPAVGRNFSPIIKQIKDLRISHWWLAGAQTDFKALNDFQDLNILRINSNLGAESEALWNKNFNLFNGEPEWPQKTSRYPPLQVPFGDVEAINVGQVLFYQKIKNVGTSYPLLTLGENNGVRSALFLGDGLWRWRLANFQLYENHEVFDGLIGKIMQYLSVKRDNRRFRVSTGKPVYDENEPVSFVGELYNASFELVNTPEVNLALKNTAGKEYNFLFNRVGKGYQLNAGVLPTGIYSYEATANYNGKEWKSEGQFTVQLLQFEFINITADHNILKAISTESEGQFFGQKELNELYAVIKKSAALKPVLVTEKSSQTLLSMPLWLLLLLVALSLEWAIRRYIGIY